jgi:hypothetical protein
MNNTRIYKTIPLALTFAAAVVLPRLGIAADEEGKEYSFILHNTTQEKITELMVSEDGEKWGRFDIGDGLKPGQSAKFTWDKSTNNEACEQYVKAEFEDGSQSNPVKHDFCKEGLELGF